MYRQRSALEATLSAPFSVSPEVGYIEVTEQITINHPCTAVVAHTYNTIEELHARAASGRSARARHIRAVRLCDHKSAHSPPQRVVRKQVTLFDERWLLYAGALLRQLHTSGIR